MAKVTGFGSEVGGHRNSLHNVNGHYADIHVAIRKVRAFCQARMALHGRDFGGAHLASYQHMTTHVSFLFLATTAFVALSISGCTGGDSDDDSCFVAGTRIDTPTGPVAIEELRIGQEVYSYDTARSELVPSKVTRVWVHHDKSYGTLSLPDGRSLGITENHPVYSVTLESYVPAAALEAGSALMRMQNSHRRASTVRDDLIDGWSALGGRATVYNIEVARYHNYFAEGVLVHNKTLDAGPPPVPDAGGQDASSSD